MSVLLIQACSKSKNTPEERAQALELYDGYFFKIIKKAIKEGELRDDIDICILSAKYGIVDSTETIEYYNQKMTTERARELRESVLAAITERIEQRNYDKVLLNLGETYREAVKGLSEETSVNVEAIEGEGIGRKGHVLKKTVRADHPTAEIQK